MTGKELLDRYAQGERNFKGANLRGQDLRCKYLVGVDLEGANLECANLEGAHMGGANLRGAYMERADLERANLRGVTVSWTSHELISEILWRAADTEPRQMLAAFVARKRGWCWNDFSAWEHPERDWAIAELRKWVKDGDGAPKLLRKVVEA